MPTQSQCESRIQQLRFAMQEQQIDGGLITGLENLYYFTGTEQNSLLAVRTDGESCLFVRKSVQRAESECPLPIVRPMDSYRELRGFFDRNACIGIEKEIMPVAMAERIGRHVDLIRSADISQIILDLRSVKDEDELSLLKESSQRLDHILSIGVPAVLKEGMTEKAFGYELIRLMNEQEHEGFARFNMFQTNLLAFQFAFGENAFCPTSFNGAGGMKGLSAVTPFMGSDRPLKKGDLLYVDGGLCYKGYHADKTKIYSFGAKPSALTTERHQACLEVKHRLLELMRPGAVCGEIYDEIMANLPENIGSHFMGYEKPVPFLAHGIGLTIDENPVIGKGVRTVLKENMVLALEPKTFVPDTGMVGEEDMFVITKDQPVPLWETDEQIMLL